MANNASAEKRVRQTQRSEDRNRTIRTRVKNARRSALESLAGSDKPKAAAACKTMASVVDKAAHSGVIHKNKANRLKSRIAKKALA